MSNGNGLPSFMNFNTIWIVASAVAAFAANYAVTTSQVVTLKEAMTALQAETKAFATIYVTQRDLSLQQTVQDARANEIKNSIDTLSRRLEFAADRATNADRAAAELKVRVDNLVEAVMELRRQARSRSPAVPETTVR